MLIIPCLLSLIFDTRKFWCLSLNLACGGGMVKQVSYSDIFLYGLEGNTNSFLSPKITTSVLLGGKTLYFDILTHKFP